MEEKKCCVKGECQSSSKCCQRHRGTPCSGEDCEHYGHDHHKGRAHEDLRESLGHNNSHDHAALRRREAIDDCDGCCNPAPQMGRTGSGRQFVCINPACTEKHCEHNFHGSCSDHEDHDIASLHVEHHGKDCYNGDEEKFGPIDHDHGHDHEHSSAGGCCGGDKPAGHGRDHGHDHEHSSAGGCCGGDKPAGHGRDHGHDHEHSSTGGCCGGDKPAGHGRDHGHDHEHSSTGGCCGGDKPAGHGRDHGHDHEHSSTGGCCGGDKPAGHGRDHGHDHEHSSTGGCCGGDKPAGHGRDHGHDHEHSSTGGCCGGDKPAGHGRDHGHDHEHSSAGGCCGGDKPAGHGRDHGHDHEHSSTGGCCGGDKPAGHGRDHGHDHEHSSAGGCCGGDKPAGHGRDHGHDHEHSSTGGCCGGDKPAGHGRDHGHDHEHSSAGGCCGGGKPVGHSLGGQLVLEDDCCGFHEEEKEPRQQRGSTGGNCGNKKLVGLAHGHNGSYQAEVPTVQVFSITQLEKDEGDIESNIVAQICSMCDPTSLILHSEQVTRFRVANMCCAGEERIIRTTLANVNGVQHVAVNLVGRYMLVKHCPVDCCAPAQKIMEMLNELHLGVTIQDINDQDHDAAEVKMDPLQTAHVILVSALFIVGLCFYFAVHVEDQRVLSESFFIASTCLGILPIIYDAYISLAIRRTIDIHLLMVIAIAGALASSEYFDGSLVVALFLIAQYIEGWVVKKVHHAVTVSTGGALPKKAFLVSGENVAVDKLKIGDILAVRAGEMIVADGTVSAGEGVVDESALTGESVPVSKKAGSNVFSGTVVQNGYIEIKVTCNPSESTLARLNAAVAEVQADRGEFAKLIDTFAAYWTPLVLVAVFILIVAGGAASNDWMLYTHRGLVLLVLACPCAIVISAPIPSISAIATAAQTGVLIRGSTIIERMNGIVSVAVDKTGTLTKANFTICDRLILNEPSFDAMQVAAAVEQKSTHPLANAIVSDYCGCIADAADSSEHPFPEVRKVKVLDGVGLEAWVMIEDDWKHVCIGNERILRSGGGKVHLTTKEAEAWKQFQSKNVHKSVLLMAVEDELTLVLALGDEVRPEASQFVSAMQQQMHMEVSMLTGDHPEVAHDVCALVGIPPDRCHARLTPEQKLAWITQQEERQRPVLMIGDGINDSVALAASTIGVAMGAEGTAMAVASAHVVLMTDNLMLLPPAIQLCQQARRVIIENFVFAVGIKIAAIVLAIMGYLHFWEAVLVDVGSLLVVVVNGMKVLRLKAKKPSATPAA